MSRFMSPRFTGLEAYTPGEQPQDQQYVKLNTNESPFPPSPKVLKAINRAEILKLNLYSDPTCAALTEAIARRYELKAKNVLAGNGSDEVLAFALRAFCDGDTPLAYSDITYGCYGVWCGLLGIPSRVIPLREDYTVDISRYRALGAAGADTAGGAHNRVETDGRQEKEPGALPAGVYGPEEIRRGIVDRLLGERMGKPGEVLNGFVWRFLFSREIIQGHNMAFAGAYLEDELFLLEYFCYARKLAMVDQPVYQYLQNPVSVTRRYLPDYMQTFQGFMKAKEDLAQRMGLGENMPLWRESSYWSGLLIAIGNEFAASNAASLAEKRRRIRGICQLPAMARAIQAIQPQGLGRNKQIVADLVRRRRFFLLSLLYGMKNRG